MGKTKEVKEDPSCIICSEDFYRDSIIAIYECNHYFCYLCALRLRIKTNRTTCCVCNYDSKSIILLYFDVIPDVENINFSELSQLCKIKDYKWKVSTDNSSIMTSVKNLQSYICNTCRNPQKFSTQDELCYHLQDRHGLCLCDLCMESKSVFALEQILYTHKELRDHNSIDKHCHKDPPHFKGHPRCEFCNIHFYDNDAIFDHMGKKHESCHICQKQGKNFEYYENVNKLENHFRDNHFLCEVPECPESVLERVFINEFDLQAHHARVHGQRGRINAVTLGFQYGGGGDSGRGRGRGRGRGDRDRQQNSQQYDDDPPPQSSTEFRITFHNDRNSSVSPNLSNFAPSHNGTSYNSPPITHNSRSPQRPRDTQDTKSELIPADVKERNKILMSKMKDLLGEEKFKEFRLLSSSFLRGELMCAEYYKSFLEYFGPKKDSDIIFFEMVELMPDESKRDALRLAHNHYHSREFGKPSASAKKAKAKAQAQEPPREDITREQDWPTLTTSPSPPPAPMARFTHNGDDEEYPALSSKPKPKPKGKAPKPKNSSSIWFKNDYHKDRVVGK